MPDPPVAVPGPACDGSIECRAVEHIHGCYSDDGTNCDHPSEHPPGPASASPAEPPEPASESAITVTTVPASDFAHWLWFRQGRAETLWLLRHGRPWTRWFWRILFGRCGYCGRWDCAD